MSEWIGGWVGVSGCEWVGGSLGDDEMEMMENTSPQATVRIHRDKPTDNLNNKSSEIVALVWGLVVVPHWW